METKTYLINSDYDYKTKKLVQVDGNALTLQFRIMDNYCMLEIKGTFKDRGVEEFKHQILCHKNQTLQVLENVNDQIEKVNQPINNCVERVHFIQRFETDNDYQLGLHGENVNDQIDLEDLIKEKN